MNTKALSDLLQFGERIHVEAKLAKNEVPKSLWETYSSFCNTLGGYILLGVSENKDTAISSQRFNIVGVDNADKIIKDFWNTIHGDKVNRNLLRDEDLETIEYDGKTIICVHIPQAEYRDKPVFINGNPYKGTYKRTYEGDFHCTEKELNDMDVSDKKQYNDELVTALEVINMVEICILVVKSAILRRESRGAHFRSDFPESIDAWKRSIILNKNKIKFEAR